MSWHCFSRKFLCSHFSRLLTSKGRWARFRLSFAVVNIIKKISVIKLRLHERKRSPVITIVWSYRAAMFVLHVDILKARAMFAPRSRAVEKLYEASLTSEYCFSLHHSFTRRKRTFFFSIIWTHVQWTMPSTFTHFLVTRKFVLWNLAQNQTFLKIWFVFNTLK